MAVQGIVGSFPWQALVFFTMWLQLVGFTDLAASSLMAVFTLGCALGSLLGGRLGALPEPLISRWSTNPSGIHKKKRSEKACSI